MIQLWQRTSALLTSFNMLVTTVGPALALNCSPMNAVTPNNGYAVNWILTIGAGTSCELKTNKFGQITSSNCYNGTQIGTVTGKIAVTAFCKVSGNFDFALGTVPNFLIKAATMAEGSAGRPHIVKGFNRRQGTTIVGESLSMVSR